MYMIRSLIKEMFKVLGLSVGRENIFVDGIDAVTKASSFVADWMICACQKALNLIILTRAAYHLFQIYI